MVNSLIAQYPNSLMLDACLVVHGSRLMANGQAGLARTRGLGERPQVRARARRSQASGIKQQAIRVLGY